MFIAISDNLLINTDAIQVIKKTIIKKQEMIAVVVDGEQYVVEVPFGEFYSRMIKAGVEPTEQFFAG
jgi:uncharacterized protein (UPF0218 family)